MVVLAPDCYSQSNIGQDFINHAIEDCCPIQDSLSRLTFVVKYRLWREDTGHFSIASHFKIAIKKLRQPLFF